MNARLSPLFTKQPPDPSQNAVLFRIVWVILAWDFQQGRECFRVRINSSSYPFSDLFAK